MVEAEIVTVLRERLVRRIDSALSLSTQLLLQFLRSHAPAVLLTPPLFWVRGVVAPEHLLGRAIELVRKAVADHDVDMGIEFTAQRRSRKMQRKLEGLDP